MIPSTNNKLLVAEDWKKIYQSYRNADFQSYDFETLRRVMIEYLQNNYPEDFNDFIDSSEYIALVDLIAYLGQNLSFRIDLNARENFLETAQRRDSILRLANLISYIPKRNVPATGFLKLTAIKTTDTVIDSNGVNLANTTVGWSDATNTNWYTQFLAVLNSTMANGYTFGTPYNKATIDGILTEQYRINSNNTDVPIFSFLKNINGTAMNFEIVPSTFTTSSGIKEEAPKPGLTFSLLYQNDNQGSTSKNTGFFVQFKQGTLGLSGFTVDNPVPNEIIGVNTPNINNTDVWLWQIDGNGNYNTLWTEVSNLTGNNVIYNSLSNSQRNVYSVTTRDQDQIDLNFADGSFGNLPKGKFSLLYRQSNGLTYVIKPEQMRGISIDIPYTNSIGQNHVLSLTLGLQYTVSNSSGTETNTSIQTKAPQTYYTQNRMVTAEDYNIAPLTLGNDILKVKSIARETSGISKYFELSDISSKYSRTNIFASDGIIYKNNHELNFEFNFTNRNEIYGVIKSKVEPILASPGLRSFYLDQYSRISLTSLNLNWVLVNSTSGQSRGYLQLTGTNFIPVSLGSYSNTNLQYATSGALIKFVAPTGYYFKTNGMLTKTQSPSTTNYVWTKIIQVIGDGSNGGVGKLDDGTGPVILSNNIDSNAIPTEIIPKFVNTFSYSFETDLVNLCLNQQNFGLSFDITSRTWKIVKDTNLNLTNDFSLLYHGDTSNSAKDSSWMIAFTWTGINYKVRYRLTNYVFESVKETAFYVDPNNLNYDYTNDTVIKDNINVLSINPAIVASDTANTYTPGSLGKDYNWQIDSAIVEPDGYIEPKKVNVSFYDQNSSGQITDPDTFNNIVEPTSIDSDTGYLHNFVYFKKSTDGLRYSLVDIDTTLITSYPTPADVAVPTTSTLYYFYDSGYNVVNSYNPTTDSFEYESAYFAYPGRSGLKFHYVHNSGNERRIDPSKSNIIDVYMLTSAYDTEYRAWLTAGTGTEPLAPTSQSLELNYSSYLEPIKTISDEIIFQAVSYKVLFGSQANVNLQATFKAVRNTAVPTSDNNLKTQILSAINNFFALENWDFGQTFNFSELSTYVMNLLTPQITNFVIVPTINNFGGLQEITCLSNEIFVNGATVDNIQIIDAITASQLNTTSIITNSGS